MNRKYTAKDFVSIVVFSLLPSSLNDNRIEITATDKLMITAKIIVPQIPREAIKTNPARNVPKTAPVVLRA